MPATRTKTDPKSRPRPTPAAAKTSTPKPSYIGLLNAIAVAEHGGGAYLTAWAESTRNAELAAVLQFVAVREAEHYHAFRKRLVELGFDVRWPDDRSRAAHDVEVAVSSMSDDEKWQHFGIGRIQEHDVFDDMFHDKQIDPITGGLLGRFIAEERDSTRRFAECYASGIVGR